MNFEKNVMVKKYNDGVIEEVEDVILREFLLDININSKPIVKLLCIEKDLQELVTGYLITENIVRPEDIQNVDIRIDGNICNVELKYIDNTPSHVTTESGDYKNVPYNFTNRDEKVTPIDWDEETLLKISNYNLSGSQLFKETGNVHSVVLAKGEEIICQCDDIGRYNAFDKAVGTAVLKGEKLSDLIAFTSGRIPSSIVQKCINSGISVIVSRIWKEPRENIQEIAQHDVRALSRRQVGIHAFTIPKRKDNHTGQKWEWYSQDTIQPD